MSTLLIWHVLKAHRDFGTQLKAFDYWPILQGCLQVFVLLLCVYLCAWFLVLSVAGFPFWETVIGHSFMCNPFTC